MDLKKYRNEKTGATFVSSFDCSGGDWIMLETVKEDDEALKQAETAIQTAETASLPIETEKEQILEEVPQETEDKDQEPKTGTDFDTITVKQIKQELDAFGIKYDPRAKKQVLYDLMMQGK